MKWPFGRKKTPEPIVKRADESSAMDRLLTKNCTRDEFALLYLKLLQETAPHLKYEMTGDMEIRMVNSVGKEATTYLHNAWISYSDSASDRKESLERYISVALKLSDEPAPLEKDQIVAIVRDSVYLEQLKGRYECAVEHLCGDIWVLYAQDLPDRTVTLRREDVNELGIDSTALRALAMENLQRVMPAAEQHGSGPWYLLTAGGDYSASLLLYDNLWQSLADSVEGEIVAVVPSRDVVLYTGSRSDEGLKAIKEQAIKIVTTGNYLISDMLIIRKSGKWEVYKAN
jgi:uncharacterized protein YtpQ (UPF0354 family)